MRWRYKYINIFVLMIIIFSVLPSSISFAQVDDEVIKEIQVMFKEAFIYIKLLGTIIAVITLAVCGIMWFKANPQEKAELTQRIGVYIIGAVLLYGGITISGVIINAFDKSLGQYVCPVADPDEKTETSTPNNNEPQSSDPDSSNNN